MRPILRSEARRPKHDVAYQRAECIDRFQLIVADHATGVLHDVDAVIGHGWKEALKGSELIGDAMAAVVDDDVEWRADGLAHLAKEHVVALISNQDASPAALELLASGVDVHAVDDRVRKEFLPHPDRAVR